MSSHRSSDEKFWQLIDESCNASLPEPELRELELYLQQPEFRQYYLNHCRLHCDLALAIRGQQAIDSLATVPLTATRQSPWSAALLTTPRALSTLDPVSLKIKFRDYPIRLAVASLFIATVFWSFWAYLIHVDQNDWFKRPVAGQSAAVATLVALKDCEWSSPAAAQTPGELLNVSRTLQIESGSMEVAFADGAQVTINGPAKFEVQSTARGFLQVGKLTASVPQRAIGFTIETPTIEIVDLGTEFGVDVDKTGRTDVQVLKGAVTVNSAILPDVSKAPRSFIRMTAGDAKRFTPQPEKTGAVIATEIAPWLDKTRSAGNPHDERGNLPAETKYATAVLADRPLGYWRFSDTDGHRAFDASGHGNHGEYAGFVSAKSPGICPNTSDRSIRFLGKAYGGYVQIRDFELPASCTVEIWARSATPAWNDYGWLLSCAVANGVQLNPSGEGRGWHGYFHNAGNAARMLGPHDGPADIADRFHQYVISYDASTDRGAMYSDGVLVRETANLFGANPRREPARLTLYVGCVDPRTPTPRWGEGFVDELAIYGAALTSDAVKWHYEAAGYSTIKNSNP